MYSIDKAYVNYFACAAEGKYHCGPIKNRTNVVAFATGTALAGAFRTLKRTIVLISEIAKIAFYSLASLSGNPTNIKCLRDHGKFFALNAAALIALPMQAMIHTVAIGVGIINPKIAYRMMQGALTPVAWITSLENKIASQYQAPEWYTSISRHTKERVTKYFDNKPFIIKVGMAALINEFSDSLEVGLVAPIGYRKLFHLFGANPKVLSDDQKEMTPILLLNGNFSHQGNYLRLLHTLEQAGNKRPVYTVNLPPNHIGYGVIIEKIEQIREQYNKSGDESFKIDLIGHSMGSSCMQELLRSELDFRVTRAIALGGPFMYEPSDPKCEIFDITGTRDILVPYKSALHALQNRREIDSGHMGLLSHATSLHAIQEFLDRPVEE